MNFRFFAIFLKTYLKSKALLLCFFLLPISLGLLIMSFKLEENTKISVGIYVNGEDIAGIIDELIQNDTIDFEIVENQDSVYDNVSNGIYDLGYIFDFDAGFNEQLNEIIKFNENKEIFAEKEVGGDTLEIINNASLSELTSLLSSPVFDPSSLMEVVKLEGDFYYKYINNVVFSVVFEKMVPYLGIYTLNEYGVYEDIEMFKKRVEEHAMADTSFNIDVKNVENEKNIDEENMNDEIILKIIKGIICIYLVILSLVSLVYLNINDDNLFVQCMSSYRLKLNIIAPIYFLGIIISVLAFVISSSFLGIEILLAKEICLLILFQILLLLSSLILSKIISKEITVVFIPFIVLFILVTHPVFIDITAILPSFSGMLRFLNLLPSYLYLRSDMFGILAYFMIELLILLVLIFRSSKKEI